MSYLLLAGYRYPSGADVLSTLGKRKAVENIGGQVTISVIDENGTDLETWALHNPWVTKVTFSELGYDKDDITDATVTLRFDWATVAIANEATNIDAGLKTKGISNAVLAGEADLP